MQVFEILSIVLMVTGTWCLAFGLRVRTGISDDLRRDLNIEDKDLIPPTDVRQRTGPFWCGLSLITVGALLQIWFIVACY
jgi:hypothetical protein